MASRLSIPLAALAAGLAHGQGYPSKPVRIIVPFPPGGGTDNLARILAPRLTETLGQTFVIDNRAGASGQIGLELTARAAPDGYTLAYIDTSFTSNPSLYRKLAYDAVKDFAPVSLLASAPVVLVVHPSVPVKTLKDLIALARARPGELNFSASGAGSATHLGVELFRSAAKVDVVVIPYKGSGPAAVAVLSGEVVMTVASPSATAPHIAAGRLRALAITGEKRLAALPQVATFDESGLRGVEASTWWNALAPAGTPREVISTLNGAKVKAMQIPEVSKRLLSLGFEPIGSTPEEAAASIRNELAKWARVARETGMRAQ